jgi:malonyl-CoA/methylmalonyl-CoA synthetase
VNANLYAIFESRFPSDTAAPFLERPDGRVVSYGEMAARVSNYAMGLSALGAHAGDRVAAQVDKSPEAVFLYLACLKAGLIFLPLNPAYSSDEIAYFIGDAAPSIFVCQPGDEDKIEALAGGRPLRIKTLGTQGDGSWIAHLEDIGQTGPSTGEPKTATRAEDDTAAILYTSGTTGRPKGAMITHLNLASNALALHEIWGFRNDDVLLHALPIFHVHGLFVAINTVLLNGSSMLFLDRYDPQAVIDQMPRATVFMGVPTYYTRLLASGDFDAGAYANMRLFISGSAPLLAETFAEFATRTGHEILERYGMTETGMITSNPLDGERLAGTVGYPLPDVEVRLAGEKGEILGPGDVGVLHLIGPNVFAGYWQNSEKTKEEFTEDGYFITGDFASIDASGRVSIVGRAKDLIISGGLNVYPKEVETEIDAIEGVLESAVVGMPHRDFGEQVVAFVVRSPGAEKLDADEIIENLAQCLARYKQPKSIHFIDALPRNAMGKVQKNALRDQPANTVGTPS